MFTCFLSSASTSANYVANKHAHRIRYRLRNSHVVDESAVSLALLKWRQVHIMFLSMRSIHGCMALAVRKLCIQMLIHSIAVHLNLTFNTAVTLWWVVAYSKNIGNQIEKTSIFKQEKVLCMFCMCLRCKSQCLRWT